MVGNAVLNENNKPIIITYDYMESLFEYANWDDLNPINLTPKILEQAGFEKYADTMFLFNYQGFTFTYLYTYSGGDWYFELNGDRLNISYLHEVQNIIYILCDKTELPIDIDKLEL